MKLRIGLPLIGGAAWHGGVTYLDAIVRAFRVLPADEQPEIWLIVGMCRDANVSMHQELIHLADGIIAFNVDTSKYTYPQYRCVVLTDFLEIDKFVDFIFPLNFDSLPGFASASWIPDLQHKYLQQFFTPEDIDSRDHALDFVVDAANVIIVSSECVKKNFQSYYPSFSGRLAVVHFYSRFDDSVFALDPVSITKTYALPDRFIICCNQFWQHKNHDNLFRALAKTKSQVHLVCTGGHADYRNVEWFQKLRCLLQELEIESRVTILGLIPRRDQLQLIRRSIGVIQPSLFEGWSTVMEDARGLGKRVLASSIPTHLEQAVYGAEYFDPYSVDEIAALIDLLNSSSDVGPNVTAEDRAKLQINAMQAKSARYLMQVARDAVASNKQFGVRYSMPAYQLTLKRLTSMLQAKVMLLSRAERALVEKENVIQSLKIKLQSSLSDRQLIGEQAKTIRAYQLAYGHLPLLRPISRVLRRTREIIWPRLGNLNQYAPRPLSVGSHKNPKIRKQRHDPKVSIVTPSFGQGAYIEKTLISVLDQQYPNLEYFVQDGASKDGTVDVLRNYEAKLTGWTSEKDSGQSQAINRGFAKTSGEIMAWLNSDDLLLPGALSTIVDYFNRHPEIDVVYGNRLLIDANDMEIGRWILPGHNSAILSWVDYVPQETIFWRRRIWDKVGGQIDESFFFAMDWDLLVRFRDAGAKFAHIPKFIGAFRIHEHQKTSANINELGNQEMDRIRARLLGRVPSSKETRIAILSFILKHVIVDMFYRIKTRLGVQT